MILSSLSKACRVNLPGVRSVEYVPTIWVDASTWVPRPYWPTGYSITLAQGSWLSADLLELRTGWQEQGRRPSQGVNFEDTISGVLPYTNDAVSELLAEMMEYRYLVRFRDANGNTWLLGSLESPLDFRFSAGSGNRESGLNTYNVEWLAQAAEPARKSTQG